MTRVAAPTAPLQVLSRPETGLAARGALLLLFGVSEAFLLLFAFRVPHITTGEMLQVLTGFMLVDGLVALVEAAAAVARRGRWRLRALNALPGLVAGVTLLLIGHGFALRVFAVWAIVTALLEAAEALRPAAEAPAGIVAAFLALAFSLFVLAGPIHDRAALMLVAAGYGVVAGVLRLSRAAHSG